MNDLNGILLLDKPAGITSAAAVNRIKRLLPRGTKIGHAGTLDPFATGLLILMVGKATKRSEDLMNQPKEYEATIQFGATTETDDLDSPQQIVTGAIAPEPARLAEALQRFVGEIEQIPPAYSALKISGKRACDRVRAGETIQIRPRLVRVYEVTLMDYAWPSAKVRINCGRGTYIRAIARDLGERLKVGGFLTQLRRTRSGKFGVGDASTVEQFETQGILPHLNP